MSDVQPGSGVPQGAPEQQPQNPEILSRNERTEQELLLRHGLNSSPVFPTPPATQAYLAFKEALLYGASGFTLLGEFGSGRKFALLAIRNLLQQEFPELESITWAPGDELTSATSRWGSLLSSANHRFLRGTPDGVKSRLINLIDERTAVAGVYRFVIFILNIEFLDWAMMDMLANLKVNLNIKGIQLFIAGVAEIHAFTAILDSVSISVQKEKIRALLGTGYVLRPLTSTLDLHSILSAIDAAIFQEAGGLTWVQFFLPRACRSGFTLADQAETFKEAVDQYAANARVSARLIFETIRRLLGEASKVDHPGLVVGVDDWKKAMGLASGDGIVYLSAPKEI